MGGQHTESVLISQLEQSVALEFERTDAARKLRLLLSELLFIMAQVGTYKFMWLDLWHSTGLEELTVGHPSWYMHDVSWCQVTVSYVFLQIKEPKPEFYHKSSELFESEVYLEEVSDVLCIAQAGISNASTDIWQPLSERFFILYTLLLFLLHAVVTLQNA